MKAVIQRVTEANVVVEGAVVGAIQNGLLALVGVVDGDSERDVHWMAKKLVALRIFGDEQGKMNCSVSQVEGKILLVSQFTLCADTRKGNRPSFGAAMEPNAAQRLFELLVEEVSQSVAVETGRFQTHMEVRLTNDGPVTILLDSRDQKAKA